MKVLGKHPEKLNDPIIGHPAMKGRRWQIDPAYGPHTSYKKILHTPKDESMKEFARDSNDTWTDTRHNDVDIGYTDFYDELDPYNDPNQQNKSDYTVDVDVEEPSIDEKNDRCTRIAKRKYKKWPSAYASGAVVKCRQGKIWKDISEESIDENGLSKEKSQGLHGWFARRGGKGGKGWVDCNTCRKDPKTGQKKCKACGRQAGEKREKYPACRPTPSQCTKKGTRSKKGPSRVSWKKNESINESSQTTGIITGQMPTGKVSTNNNPVEINTGYKKSKVPTSGNGMEKVNETKPYDFAQYKKDNSKFGNGNIIKPNGKISLYELAKSVLKESHLDVPEVPDKITISGLETEIPTNRVVGPYKYYGFTDEQANKIHRLCMRFIFHPSEELKNAIKDVYFYLVGRNPILHKIPIHVSDYPRKRFPEFDIVHGVVSGIPPQDIDHWVVNTKGRGGGAKPGIHYIQRPSDV